jgi:hypothetical protein
MTRRRSTARAVSIFSAVLLALAACFSACAETRFGLGDDCLKDQDCLSGICSGGKCVAAPPIGTVSPPDAAPDTSVSEGGGNDAAEGGNGDTGGADTSGPNDAADGPPAVDARPDSPPRDSAADAPASDAGGDASGSDAPVDAPADAAEDGAADAADDSG